MIGKVGGLVVLNSATALIHVYAHVPDPLRLLGSINMTGIPNHGKEFKKFNSSKTILSE